MLLEIVSPEAILFKGEVQSVHVPGVNGEFQILNNHAPIVSLLSAGSVKFSGSNLTIDPAFEGKFQKVDANTYILPIKFGTIEMNNNVINILAN